MILLTPFFLHTYLWIFVFSKKKPSLARSRKLHMFHFWIHIKSIKKFEKRSCGFLRNVISSLLRNLRAKHERSDKWATKFKDWWWTFLYITHNGKTIWFYEGVDDEIRSLKSQVKIRIVHLRSTSLSKWNVGRPSLYKIKARNGQSFFSRDQKITKTTTKKRATSKEKNNKRRREIRRRFLGRRGLFVFFFHSFFL